MLIWQGFPVLVIGSSDRDKKFHPLGMAVTTSEAEEDFEFIFKALQGIRGDAYKPDVLIADCCDAISNASVQVFGEIIRVHCWAHVIRNIDKKLILLAKDVRAHVRADIAALQLSKSAAIKYRQRGDETFYFIATGDRKKVVEAEINKFLAQKQRLNWRTFDTFKKYQSAIWLVIFSGDDWKNGSCTCPVFLKSYICKHLLGIAIFKKLLIVPDIAKAIPIGQKRKRDRKSVV